jgi:WD40 repeat protein
MQVGDKVGSTTAGLLHKVTGDDERVREEQEKAEEAAGFIKMRTKSARVQQNDDLRHLRVMQDLSGKHIGAIWTMKMSSCGRLLATAGQDKVVRVWVAVGVTDGEFVDESASAAGLAEEGAPKPQSPPAAFRRKPYREYEGHTADVLDLSWCYSRNTFLLSSSMDKTVRLWHVSRVECLACFLHEDFVTAITFHPRNDKYFLSGSLDCKLRLWNIPEKKVALWNEIGSEGCNLITAANFCSGGKFAVAGTYDGRCVFFNTEERLKWVTRPVRDTPPSDTSCCSVGSGATLCCSMLCMLKTWVPCRYHTQIHARSTRGKNKKGRKISGIEPMPNSDKILVTSNDSRVRL